MATMTHDLHPTRHTITLPAVVVLVLAMLLSFLAGRAAATQRPVPAPPAAAAPPTASVPVEPPPWATHGFRDDETIDECSQRSDCNG